MDSAQRPARYRSSQAYAGLFTYRTLRVDPEQFLVDQFGVEVRVASRSGSEWAERVQVVCAEIDALPLQAKDVIRHGIDEIRIQGDESFVPGTTGTWSAGILRINAEAPSLFRSPCPEGVARTRSTVLRSTILHECGHALVEDPRVGLLLRDYVRLVAAAGWLPDPRKDPLAYGPCGDSLDTLTDHYVSALREIDSRWEPDRSVGAIEGPGTFQLDRDMMAVPPPGPRPELPGRPSLGLRAPRDLARALATDGERGLLSGGLEDCGISLATVDRAINRRPAPSVYAQEGVAETPAELFRCLHQRTPGDRVWSEAMREARRCLLDPWRKAERLGPPRALAPGILVVSPRGFRPRSDSLRRRRASRGRE